MRTLACVVVSAGLAAVTALQACSSSSSHGKTSGNVDAGSDAVSHADVTQADTSHPDSTLAVDSAPSLDAPLAVDSTTHDATTDVTIAPDGPHATDASDASVTDADAASPCGPDGGLPADLSCTGLYSDWATKTIAPGLQTYTPAYLLWSDGAVKTRWIYLPPGTQIDTTDMDDWVFPVGTKIWKQFVVGGQLVETRLMWKEASGWTFADYRWAANGASAPLLTTGEQNVNGTTYEIPALYRCPSCHGGRLDDVLGFDLVGIGVASAQGLTLPMLVAAGQVTQPPPADPIVIPEDSTGLAAPALGWLHVNCGVSCHNSNPAAMAAQTRLYLKLLSGQMYPEGGTGEVANLDPYTTSVGVLSNLTPNGQHYQRIDPGDAAASLMPLMDLARGDASFEPMPPIISHIPDTADVTLVQSWINAL